MDTWINSDNSEELVTSSPSYLNPDVFEGSAQTVQLVGADPVIEFEVDGTDVVEDEVRLITVHFWALGFDKVIITPFLPGMVAIPDEVIT